MKQIFYTRSNDVIDLEQIKKLQEKNLRVKIPDETIALQGFVTCSHTLELLEKMNHPHPHFIAKSNGQVVGYTLVMECQFQNDIPELKDLFTKISSVPYKGEKIKQKDYFIMGQVCVDSSYRGKGIFRKLYQEMKSKMSNHYRFIITEVSSKNIRSVNAHEAIGFQRLLSYPYREDEEWIVYLLETNMQDS